jgi:hypothetical protein
LAELNPKIKKLQDAKVSQSLNMSQQVINLEDPQVKVAYPFIILMVCSIVAFPSCLATSQAIVAVDPKEKNVKVGQVFTVNVNITSVSELVGFDFCLSYNKTILEIVKVDEGQFLKNVGPTFVINLTTEGCVWLVVVLYNPDGLMLSANGSGILATITFKARTEGKTLLDLHSINPYKPNEVKLAKDPPESVVPIPNVALDGYVVVSNSSDPDPPADPPSDSSAEKSPDINTDGKVDIRDVTIVAKAYYSYPGHPNWNEKADLDNNQKVDIVDISKVAIKFGTAL